MSKLHFQRMLFWTNLVSNISTKALKRHYNNADFNWVKDFSTKDKIS